MDRSHARAVRSCGGGAVRFLSLFAGIGGLDLGLERAGWECIGQVEIDQFATAVLAKHWPDVRRWSDVREITASDVVGSVGRPDAIVGGFPCQPWSVAGKQRGADDPRHLWPEYYRLVCDLRPRWVVGENVPGLLSTGADAVLADLEAAGYTCWPVVLGADDVGAPHRRKRVFFVAQLADASSGKSGQSSKWKRREGISRGGRDSRGDSPTQYVVADADAGLRDRTGNTLCAGRLAVDNSGADVADAASPRLERRGDTRQSQIAQPWTDSVWPARPGERQHQWEEPRAVESEVGSAADGVSRRLVGWRRGALKGLGNAVVPQVAEVIGRAIMEADRE